MTQQKNLQGFLVDEVNVTTMLPTLEMLPMSRILEKLVISQLVNSIHFVTCRALLPYSKETISFHDEPDASSPHPFILFL
jgi:hypothetical protein